MLMIISFGLSYELSTGNSVKLLEVITLLHLDPCLTNYSPNSANKNPGLAVIALSSGIVTEQQVRPFFFVLSSMAKFDFVLLRR